MNNEEYLVARTDIERIEHFKESELDQLPFGAIRLDENGKILSYNLAEATLSGRKKDKVIGKNFFTDVAPCTNVQEFAGTFREGFRKGSLHVVFPYIFDFEMEPLNVWVTLFFSDESKTAWVFVRTER